MDSTPLTMTGALVGWWCVDFALKLLVEMKCYYVYILKCSDGSYYTGVSSKPEKRLAEHQAGIDTKSYTFSRRPLRLVYIEAFQNVLEAIGREKQIKRWTRRKKEALSMEDMGLLKRFASCMNDSVAVRRDQM